MMVVRFDEIPIGSKFRVGDSTYTKSELHQNLQSNAPYESTNAYYESPAGIRGTYFSPDNMVEYEPPHIISYVRIEQEVNYAK